MVKNKEDVTQAVSAGNTDQDTNARSALPSPSSNTDVPQNEPDVNSSIFNSSDNYSQSLRLQSTAEGDIISQGGEENGRIHNQGTVYGGNTTAEDSRGNGSMGESNETVDGYVAGGKAEILSRASSDGRRVVRVSYGNSNVTFTEGKEKIF